MVLELFGLSVDTGITIITPVAAFVGGMALYSIFIFLFYRFLAERDIFKIDYEKYGYDLVGQANRFLLWVFNIIEYIVLFPLFVIFWFLAIVVLLSFLSKGQSLETIMLISISLVTAVRVTAYYREDLSRDLAKMLPFALLGVFLVDSSFFSLKDSIAKIISIPSFAETIIYYCIFVVGLEMILRATHYIKNKVFPPQETEDEE